MNITMTHSFLIKFNLTTSTSLTIKVPKCHDKNIIYLTCEIDVTPKPKIVMYIYGKQTQGCNLCFGLCSLEVPK